MLTAFWFSSLGSANYQPGEYPYSNEKSIPCNQLVKAKWNNGHLMPSVELPTIEIIAPRDLKLSEVKY